ncbi:MAG: hypothetical protein JSW06_02085 [Thermoplasmatales archaeon]|nr:MAG: hypothetical protein JSW06_02085 [Thermoplasmatales archaeon]
MMKNKNRHVLLISILILGLYFSSANVVADPVVENISIDPTNPAPLSTITITANIDGENITNVNLSVGECNKTAGVCYVYHQITMTEKTEGQYTAELTLEKSKASYISFAFDITYDGETKKLEDDSWDVDLSIESGNGDTTNGGDGDSVPGFEIIYFLITISIGILVHRNKRSR